MGCDDRQPWMRLRDAAGLPLHYLDMLWHNPDRTTVTRAEFDERLQRILEEDAWILDGNFARTLPKRLEYCDTVFFLDFPTDVCLEGVEGCSGMKREDAVVRNKAGRKIKYKINRRPSQMKKLSKSGQYAAKKAERAKSSVRAKVEHVFGVVKKQLRFRKTRYRGLEKQQAKFNIMFALANLILADRPCLAA